MPTISAMPAHSPSMLSSRLNALVMPTTHTSVSRLSSVTDVSQFSRKPKKSSTDASAICAMSLVDALSVMMSSTRPMTKITAADASSTGDVVRAAQPDHHRERRQADRHAAEERGDPGVPSIDPRLGDAAHLEGHATADANQQERQQQGEEKRGRDCWTCSKGRRHKAEGRTQPSEVRSCLCLLPSPFCLCLVDGTPKAGTGQGQVGSPWLLC